MTIETARFASSHSSAMLVRVVCGNRLFIKARCGPLQARADNPDLSLVSEAAWRDAGPG
jgi:hypothetical protein